MEKLKITPYNFREFSQAYKEAEEQKKESFIFMDTKISIVRAREIMEDFHHMMSGCGNPIDGK